jgi:glycosyltransferase involved in cell wall biosynthesis
VSGRRTPWPDGERGRTGRVGIVVANSNTRDLIAQLIFSLYHLLGRDQFAELVVVDNASTDGSRELLNALHARGLVHLIRNRAERYHGPALTQGVSWLARQERRVDYVWVLDSDAVVLRRDTVREAQAVFSRAGVAVVGQRVGDPAYDRLLRRNQEMLHPCSLMFDPALVWRGPIPPFLEDGAPATAFQIAADAAGHRLVAFPFVEGGYVLHLGRGTLRRLADDGAKGNRYHDWAVRHRDPHFGGLEQGEVLYRSFRELFDGAVGDLRPETLVEACRTAPRAASAHA